MAAVGASPEPATAATTLEVDAGYGGNFVPGRSVPVRVRISADRLVEGILRVELDGPGDDVPVSLPVEVSGGTEKEFVLSLPTMSAVAQAQVTVRANLGGAELVGEDALSFTGDVELVGLLSGVAGRVPAPVPLAADLGTARFAELTDAELAAAGALEPLGTVVTGPDGLESLNDQSRSNVLRWLGAGGHLVVDAAPGAADDGVSGLPDEWQPGAASRVQAGRGEVRFSSGAAADGRWDEVVEPTSLMLPGEAMQGAWMWSSETVADTVARDGGLRLPTVGWLAGFLVVYVLLAGPAVFLGLRFTGRANWAWLAVPAVAGLFAVGAFVVGQDLRSGAEASHASVVRTGPAGTQVTSYVGLVSRTGADGRAEFPDGWSASGLAAPFGGALGMGGGGPFPMGGGPEHDASATQVVVGSEGTVGEIDLDPGSFGLVTGWGAIDEADGLVLTAAAEADGTVSGTLRNDTGVPVGRLLVMVGSRSWGSTDQLAPGDEIEWEINAAAQGRPPDGPLEEPWNDAIGFDGPPASDTLVNYPLWETTTSQLTDPYPTGVAVAAGWTRAWTPPVDAGGTIDAGRTAFVTEAPVQVTDGSVPADAVRREFLRGSRTVAVDDARYDEAAERLQSDFGIDVGATVMRYTLPALDGAPPALQASLPGTVLGLEAWDGARWVPLERRDRAGDVVDETAFDPAFDPWTADSTFAALPPEVVGDGALYLRIVAAGFDGPGGLGVPRVEQVP